METSYDWCPNNLCKFTKVSIIGLCVVPKYALMFVQDMKVWSMAWEFVRGLWEWYINVNKRDLDLTNHKQENCNQGNTVLTTKFKLLIKIESQVFEVDPWLFILGLLWISFVCIWTVSIKFIWHSLKTMKYYINWKTFYWQSQCPVSLIKYTLFMQYYALLNLLFTVWYCLL